MTEVFNLLVHFMESCNGQPKASPKPEARSFMQVQVHIIEEYTALPRSSARSWTGNGAAEARVSTDMVCPCCT